MYDVTPVGQTSWMELLPLTRREREGATWGSIFLCNYLWLLPTALPPLSHSIFFFHFFCLHLVVIALFYTPTNLWGDGGRGMGYTVSLMETEQANEVARKERENANLQEKRAVMYSRWMGSVWCVTVSF